MSVGTPKDLMDEKAKMSIARPLVSFEEAFADPKIWEMF